MYIYSKNPTKPHHRGSNVCEADKICTKVSARVNISIDA